MLSSLGGRKKKSVGFVDPCSTDQKSVGVDAVRGAGQQGTQLRTRYRCQISGFLRKYAANLIHPEPKCMAVIINTEFVPCLEPVQIPEQPGFRQSPVTA